MQRLTYLLLFMLVGFNSHAFWYGINYDEGTMNTMKTAYGANYTAEKNTKEQLNDLNKIYQTTAGKSSTIFAQMFMERTILNNSGDYWQENNYYYNEIKDLVCNKIAANTVAVAKLMWEEKKNILIWLPYLIRVCEEVYTLAEQMCKVVLDGKQLLNELQVVVVSDQVRQYATDIIAVQNCITDIINAVRDINNRKEAANSENPNQLRGELLTNLKRVLENAKISVQSYSGKNSFSNVKNANGLNAMDYLLEELLPASKIKSAATAFPAALRLIQATLPNQVIGHVGSNPLNLLERKGPRAKNWDDDYRDPDTLVYYTQNYYIVKYRIIDSVYPPHRGDSERSTMVQGCYPHSRGHSDAEKRALAIFPKEEEDMAEIKAKELVLSKNGYTVGEFEALQKRTNNKSFTLTIEDSIAVDGSDYGECDLLCHSQVEGHYHNPDFHAVYDPEHRYIVSHVPTDGCTIDIHNANGFESWYIIYKYKNAKLVAHYEEQDTIGKFIFNNRVNDLVAFEDSLQLIVNKLENSVSKNPNGDWHFKFIQGERTNYTRNDLLNLQQAEYGIARCKGFKDYGVAETNIDNPTTYDCYDCAKKIVHNKSSYKGRHEPAICMQQYCRLHDHIPTCAMETSQGALEDLHKTAGENLTELRQQENQALTEYNNAKRIWNPTDAQKAEIQKKKEAYESLKAQREELERLYNDLQAEWTKSDSLIIDKVPRIPSIMAQVSHNSGGIDWDSEKTRWYLWNELPEEFNSRNFAVLERNPLITTNHSPYVFVARGPMHINPDVEAILVVATEASPNSLAENLWLACATLGWSTLIEQVYLSETVSLKYEAHAMQVVKSSKRVTFPKNATPEEKQRLMKQAEYELRREAEKSRLVNITTESELVNPVKHIALDESEKADAPNLLWPIERLNLMRTIHKRLVRINSELMIMRKVLLMKHSISWEDLLKSTIKYLMNDETRKKNLFKRLYNQWTGRAIQRIVSGQPRVR